MVWSAALALAVLVARRQAPVAVVAPAPRAEARSERPSLISDYLSLTKPKVISLLLVTTLAAMYITEAGAPSLWLVFWTMVGGYLAAGGAGAINCAFDRDIDINMGRTSRRPVPSGRIAPRSAFIFGLILSLLAVVVLLVFTTPWRPCSRAWASSIMPCSTPAGLSAAPGRTSSSAAARGPYRPWSAGRPSPAM